MGAGSSKTKGGLGRRHAPSTLEFMSTAAPHEVAAGRPVHPPVENPLSFEACPDPSVVRVGDDFFLATTEPRWWAFAPGDAAYPLRRVHQGDFNQVVEIGHVFPKGHAPAWLRNDPWAPELHHDPELGYTVTFTGRNADGKLCIGIAFAERPEGPYREMREGPFLEAPDIGVIDAHIFLDEKTGRRWFYWKEDWNDRPSEHKRTPIFAAELVMTEDGPKLVGERVRVLENDLPFEGELVEGASVVAREGRYYMFYSAGPYTTGEYLTSVAVSDSPTGPFVKLGENLMPNDARWEGRGHGFVAHDKHGNDWFVCHGYPTGNLENRLLLVFPILWEAGWPRIDTTSPSVRPAPDTVAA